MVSRRVPKGDTGKPAPEHLKPGRVMRLVWNDAAIDYTQKPLNEITEDGDGLIKQVSIGHLIRETKRSISIGQSYFYSDGFLYYDCILHVPKPWVVERTWLEETS